MDDLEIFTPLDSRVEREFDTLTTLETQTNVSSLSFNNLPSNRTNDSKSEAEIQVIPLNKDLFIPNGLESAIFRPLYEAVFRASSLKKELVVSVDLLELARALLMAARSVDNPFSLLGNYVKGLVFLYFSQLKYLQADFGVYSKRIVGSDLAILKRQETTAYYESDDNYEGRTRRKYKKRRVRDNESVSTIQDQADRYQGEMVPLERLEMLRAMNLGFPGSEYLFMTNEVSPVVGDYLNEMSLSGKLSGDRDWLSFDDLRMLSSPFKLNAYSFTPNFDDATVAASSEVSFSTGYDIDWSLRNDPLNYKSPYYAKYLEPSPEEAETLRLEDAKVARKRKNTLRLYDVDLVQTDIKYDKRPSKYKPKKVVRKKSAPRESTSRKTTVQESPQVDPKQKTLDKMFDNYFTSVLDKQNPISEDREKTVGFSGGFSQNGFFSQNSFSQSQLSQKELSQLSKDSNFGEKRAEIQVERPVRERIVRNSQNDKQAGIQQVKETTFQESTDGFGTLDVLNWLRESFRKNDFNSMKFEELTTGLKAGRASVVLLRVLILANSNFISISQEKEVINITPAVS